MEKRAQSVGASEWVEMQIKGLLLDPGHDVPVVILRSVGGHLLLPIWIGVPEASAIAMALEGVRSPRPMTHDLLRSCIEALGARLERVEIWGLLEGTFHARLRLVKSSGESEERVEVDSRPSDALALATRIQAPIWVARAVLEAALSAELATESSDDERLRSWLEQARPEDLGKYKM